MPLVDYDHNATWWLLYREMVGERHVTYGREWMQARKQKYQQRARWLHEILPDGPGLVVGCGFGFLLEGLRGLRGDVWGTDTSTWIHDRLTQEALPAMVPKIFRLDIVDDARHAKETMGAAAGEFAWVLTEEVLSGCNNQEAVELAFACAQLAPSVYHIINTWAQARPPFNSKDIDQWADMLLGQTCLDTRGRQSGGQVAVVSKAIKEKLVCVLYYRNEASVEIYDRDDWDAAPFRDLQLLRRGPGFVIESITPRLAARRETPHQWSEGEHFWVWRDNEPSPFSCDWMELADYMRERMVLADNAPILSVSFDDLKGAGVKYGLNLSNKEWSSLYLKVKADYQLEGA